jgi:hypothetical protein
MSSVGFDHSGIRRWRQDVDVGIRRAVAAGYQEAQEAERQSGGRGAIGENRRR